MPTDRDEQWLAQELNSSPEWRGRDGGWQIKMMQNADVKTGLSSQLPDAGQDGHDATHQLMQASVHRSVSAGNRSRRRRKCLRTTSPPM